MQTNDEPRNEVIAFERLAGGSLAAAGRYETDGGSGECHFAWQGSPALSGDGAWLLVGGGAPTSVAVHGELVYVLNSATSSIAGSAPAGSPSSTARLGR